MAQNKLQTTFYHNFWSDQFGQDGEKSKLNVVSIYQTVFSSSTFIISATASSKSTWYQIFKIESIGIFMIRRLSVHTHDNMVIEWLPCPASSWKDNDLFRGWTEIGWKKGKSWRNFKFCRSLISSIPIPAQTLDLLLRVIYSLYVFLL